MIEHLPYLAFWTPGPLELSVILAVLVLVFGKRLPDIARSVGRSLTEFKKGINEAKDTKDDFVSDVRRVKNDVVDQAKDASGLNDLDKSN
ncbi:MAG: twin-arginine translocase TatA/TatE family subunit [Sedimentisphaerales bacterium]|nr:twin-arginine translocase TatA/TatE family subunit [Sedimentisphaerales bacterium]